MITQTRQRPNPTGSLPPNVVINGRNGHGYELVMPRAPAGLHEAITGLPRHSEFSELPAIVGWLAVQGSLLVTGAPGAGKTHLVRDIQEACRAENLPVLTLATHINGGNRSGAANLWPNLSIFRREMRRAGGLVIFDNVDYVGYKGRNGGKSLDSARLYAWGLLGIVRDLIDDPKLMILATAHDDAWRRSHWAWDDEQVNESARAVLELFLSRMEFEGRMPLAALARILYSRNLARGERGRSVTHSRAIEVTKHLDRMGRANFFHANHLSIRDFLVDRQAAINMLDRGRDQRSHGTRT